MALGKSKPKVPMYQEMKDTPWITRNRELNTTTYGNINRDLNNVNVFDDATKQQLNSVVDDWYNRSLSDFDRSYAQTMNKYLARDYNRLGTTGGTSSLLTRDNYNLAQQRKLADLASNRSDRYDDLINQELNRRYKWLDTNYNYFTNSGNEIQTNDLRNWAIRNQNLDRQYQNDISKYNNSAGMQLGKIGTLIGSGIATAFGGPLAGMAVAGLGNALTSDATNMLGGANDAINLGINYNDLYKGAQNLGARYGLPYWSTGSNLKGDEVSSGYNPFSSSLGAFNNNSFNDNSLWQAMINRGLI